jgi:hypothetical protein
MFLAYLFSGVRHQTVLPEWFFLILPTFVVITIVALYFFGPTNQPLEYDDFTGKSMKGGVPDGAGEA